MGFRKLKNFNQTILAKKAQDSIINPKNIWVFILKSKYLKEQHFLKVQTKVLFLYLKMPTISKSDINQRCLLGAL